MTLDAQRKLLGADGDIERDCDCIARKAAGQVLDRILVAPSISDLMDGAEELDVADLGEREISNALDLERRAEDKGRPEDCHALAQWLERHRHVAMHSQGWVLAMLKWYAKASLSGVAAATSAVGRAYGGWFDDSDLFAEPEEDAATVEDERLVQDTLVAAACELSAARRGDSYGLYQWFLYYMGIHDETICERNFDKAMDCLVRLVGRSHEVNQDVIRDLWAFQGPYQLERLVKSAPLESKWDDHEYPYVFGLCHERGWVLEKDLGKALDYYRKAATFGYKKAADAVKRVEIVIVE